MAPRGRRRITSYLSTTTRMTPGMLRNACLSCRQRKLKCDRQDPCTNCISRSLECKQQLLRQVSRRVQRPLPESNPSTISKILDRLDQLENYLNLTKDNDDCNLDSTPIRNELNAIRGAVPALAPNSHIPSGGTLSRFLREAECSWQKFRQTTTP